MSNTGDEGAIPNYPNRAPAHAQTTDHGHYPSSQQAVNPASSTQSAWHESREAYAQRIQREEALQRRMIRKYFDGDYDREREELQRERDRRASEREDSRTERLRALRNDLRRRTDMLTAVGVIIMGLSALLGFALHQGWFVLLVVGLGVLLLARSLLMHPVSVPDYDADPMAGLVEPPTDRQLEALIDAMVNRDLQTLYASAQRMMSIEKASDKLKEIPTTMFPEWDEVESAYVSVKIGSDGNARYTPRGLAVLAFTDQQVVTYEGAIDLTTGHSAYEKIREFFYQDIISVSRTRNTLPVDNVSPAAGGKPPVTTRETFLIDLADGNNVTIVLRDTYLSGKQAHDDIPLTMSEETIEMIRHLVREKKRQALAELSSGPASAAAFRA